MKNEGKHFYAESEEFLPKTLYMSMSAEQTNIYIESMRVLREGKKYQEKPAGKSSGA